MQGVTDRWISPSSCLDWDSGQLSPPRRWSWYLGHRLPADEPRRRLPPWLGDELVAEDEREGIWSPVFAPKSLSKHLEMVFARVTL